MNDLFGKALLAYHHGDKSDGLFLHNKFSTPDKLELDGYFFEADEMTDLELIAMDFCQGRIGDIGAAAGRHSLYLQSEGHDVAAVEVSGNCVTLMKERGVKKTIHNDFFELTGEKFDTLFLMMNGIGISSDLSGFKRFLKKADEVLSPDGLLIFDSADISYLKNEFQLPEKPYFGEIDYCYEWNGKKGEWFSWLYIDQSTLKLISSQCGWNAQVVYEDEEDGQYLVILTKR